MIEARNVTKSYDALQVLRGVSLTVEAGEVFGFVGPNGAGKSTFLKCLLGIVRPDGGEIRVAGVDAISDSLGARHKVGYAPGEIGLYSRMRVVQLLDFALAFHADVDRDWAFEQLDAFGLPRDRKVGKLSHGMKRQVLVIQALAVRTPIVILDEPMEGLDPEFRRRVEVMLRAEAQKGRAVLFSSHDLASVERVCDRVAFLRAGDLLETGSIGEILDRVGRLLTLTLRDPRDRAALPDGDGFQWEGFGTRWQLRFEGPLESALARIATLPLAGVRDASGGLMEVFEALYGKKNGGGGAAD